MDYKLVNSAHWTPTMEGLPILPQVFGHSLYCICAVGFDGSRPNLPNCCCLKKHKQKSRVLSWDNVTFEKGNRPLNILPFMPQIFEFLDRQKSALCLFCMIMGLCLVEQRIDRAIKLEEGAWIQYNVHEGKK